LNRPYRVTQRLPAARGEPQYRIRCILTEHEFAASDGELRAIVREIRGVRVLTG
jgi:hypothetical protein